MKRATVDFNFPMGYIIYKGYVYAGTVDVLKDKEGTFNFKFKKVAPVRKDLMGLLRKAEKEGKT